MEIKELVLKTVQGLIIYNGGFSFDYLGFLNIDLDNESLNNIFQKKMMGAIPLTGNPKMEVQKLLFDGKEFKVK